LAPIRNIFTARVIRSNWRVRHAESLSQYSSPNWNEYTSPRISFKPVSSEAAGLQAQVASGRRAAEAQNNLIAHLAEHGVPGHFAILKMPDARRA
jgi:hypothetical protein